MMLRFFSLLSVLLLLGSDLMGQTCTCVEYIYLNEPTDGAVHKYEVRPVSASVDPDETLVEVGGANGIPWYPGASGISVMPNPHGLIQDINGWLYIGEDSNGDVRRFDCEGNIRPTSEFVIDNGGNNYASDGIYLYVHTHPNNGTTRLKRFNLCDALGTDLNTPDGEVQLAQSNDNTRSWDVKLLDNGMFLVTASFLSGNDNEIYMFEPTESDWTSATSFNAILTEADGILSNAAGWDIWGAAVDPNGNIFIAYIDNNPFQVAPQTSIQKWSPDGSGSYTLAGTISDNNANGSGFNKAAGIVYSETSQLLYVSTVSSVDDCVSVLDPVTFTYLGSVVPSPGSGSNSKGIAINWECCPPTDPGPYTTDLCDDEVTTGMVIPLGELTNCNGNVCQGTWNPIGALTDMAFDNCNNAVTITGNAPCGNFTLSGGGVGTSCPAYNLTYNVCITNCSCINPAATTNGVQGTCTGSTPNNDASITLSMVMNGDQAGISLGTSYTGAVYDIMSNIDISGGSGGFTGLIHGTTYTIRVYNGANDCFQDYTVTTPTISCASSCTCNEYIYLNEITGAGSVHKYRVEAYGDLTEINPSGPWYNDNGSGNLNQPHGLGRDLNGFVYIAKDWVNTEPIRRLDCDGNLVPTNEFVINDAGTFNIISVDNVIYANTSGSQDVTAFNTCDGSIINTACFDNPPVPGFSQNSMDWGLHYDARTGYFYTAYPQDNNDDPFGANRAAIYRYTSVDFGTGTCVQPWIESASGATFGQMPAVGANELPLTNISGMTTDADGNLYYAATGYLEPGQLIKFDANGNFVGASAIDAVDGGGTPGGYFGARGIVYSEVSQRLYVSTQTTTFLEDCISYFDLDLNYLGSAADYDGNTGQGQTGFGTGKAMAITQECCPDFMNLAYDQTACVATTGDEINLAEYLPCENVCPGDWMEVSGTTGTGGNVGTFNDCNNTFTFQNQGEACFSYNYTPGVTGNEICNEFQIAVCITFTDNPSASTASMMGTCDMSSIPNDDAQVNLTAIANGDRVGIIPAGSFLDYGQANGPNYAVAVDLGGANSYNFMGLMHNTSYFVRVFNGSDGCFVDYPVSTPTITCATCALTITQNTQSVCQDNGTTGNIADDYFTIDVNATVNNGGTQYEAVLNANPNGTGGTVLGTTTYGQLLTLGNGTNGATGTFVADGITTYTITLRDMMDNFCHQELTTSVVSSCNSCPTISNSSLPQMICEGQTVTNLFTNTDATSDIEFVYFTTQQTGNAVYVGGMSLGIATPSAGIASISNVAFPGADTYYVYARLTPAPSDIACRPNTEMIVTVNALPNQALMVSDPTICEGEDGLITIANSEIGVSYQLRLAADDSPVASPVLGSGGEVSIVLTGLTVGTYVYNILATNAITGCNGVLTDLANVMVNNCDFPDFPPPICDIPACHTISTDIYFGAGVTPDAPGNGDMTASLDVDDGICFPNDIRRNVMIRLPITFYNNTGNAAYIQGWIDWDGDTNFEADEQVANLTIPFDGTNLTQTLSQAINVPPNAVQDDGVAMRWRISTDATIIAEPCGMVNCAADGEVEDYLIRVACPEETCLPMGVTILRN